MLVITKEQMKVFADHAMKEFVSRLTTMTVKRFPAYVQKWGRQATVQKVEELVPWLMNLGFKLETDIENYTVLYFSREDLQTGKLADESIRVLKLTHVAPGVRIKAISADTFKQNYS